MKRVDLPIDENGKYVISQLNELFKYKTHIKINSLLDLINQTKLLLRKEPNIIDIQTQDAVIMGDVHGQYHDFYYFLQHFNGENNLIMLGDYVDRGNNSIEIVITLCCLKCNYPNKVYLLRGNHESRRTTKSLKPSRTFYSECSEKYSCLLYDEFMLLFDCLPIALIARTEYKTFFLCHGGISPKVTTVNEINKQDRFKEVILDGVIGDMLWSDPVPKNQLKELPGFYRNVQRGTAYYFGVESLSEFLQTNKFDCLIRGHQCCGNGCEIILNEEKEYPMCITVFSAPHYSSGSYASIMKITDSIPEFILLQRPVKVEQSLDPIELFLHSLQKMMLKCGLLIHDLLIQDIMEQENDSLEEDYQENSLEELRDSSEGKVNIVFIPDYNPSKNKIKEFREQVIPEVPLHFVQTNAPSNVQLPQILPKENKNAKVIQLTHSFTTQKETNEENQSPSFSTFSSNFSSIAPRPKKRSNSFNKKIEVEKPVKEMYYSICVENPTSHIFEIDEFNNSVDDKVVLTGEEIRESWRKTHKHA